jgi:cbb3-type cytochrome oxidase subunit 3
MLSGIMIALLLLLFLGIVGWAFDGAKRRDFERAALLPLLHEIDRETRR